MHADLDEINISILSLLREDARRTFKDIGLRVNLSAPAVKRRVDRLEEHGYIRGYCAIADPARLGWPLAAVVELYCDGTMTADEITTAVERYPEISAAFSVAGPASAVLLIRTRDTQHLEDVLLRIREANGVLRTETSIILSALVERPFAT